MFARRLRAALAAAGMAAAATTMVVAGDSTASANTLDQWYPTSYDCQYAGDTYAQQGLTYGFSCDPGNGGWILTGWE